MLKKSARFKNIIIKLINEKGIWIIDEISMLSANLFEIFIKIIKFYGFNYKDIQIIGVGDVKQLDPIINYFKGSKIINETFNTKIHWLPYSFIFNMVFVDNIIKFKKNYRSSNDPQFTEDKCLIATNFNSSVGKNINNTTNLECLKRINSSVVNKPITDLITEHPTKTIIVPFKTEKLKINKYLLGKNKNDKKTFNRKFNSEISSKYISDCQKHLDNSSSYEPKFTYSLKSPVMLRKNISITKGLVTEL